MSMKKHKSQFDYSKLNGRTAELGLNRKAVAAAAGMTPATYSLKLKGESEFTQKEIEAIMRFLNIPMTEVERYFFCGNNSV